MNEDRFLAAGKAFRDEQARDFSARDQALAQLADIRTTCEEGITAFYKAAGFDRPDVYIDQPRESELQIAYGSRPGPEPDSIFRGPTASVLVTPEGKTLLETNIEWHPPSARTARPKVLLLPTDNWQDTFENWLVHFLQESERRFRDL